MKELMPRNVKKWGKWSIGKIPLFHYANIEKVLNNIYEPTVKLKSGGYLVINPTFFSSNRQLVLSPLSK